MCMHFLPRSIPIQIMDYSPAPYFSPVPPSPLPPPSPHAGGLAALVAIAEASSEYASGSPTPSWAPASPAAPHLLGTASPAAPASHSDLEPSPFPQLSPITTRTSSGQAQLHLAGLHLHLDHEHSIIRKSTSASSLAPGHDAADALGAGLYAEGEAAPRSSTCVGGAREAAASGSSGSSLDGGGRVAALAVPRLLTLPSIKEWYLNRVSMIGSCGGGEGDEAAPAASPPAEQWQNGSVLGGSRSGLGTPPAPSRVSPGILPNYSGGFANQSAGKVGRRGREAFLTPHLSVLFCVPCACILYWPTQKPSAEGDSAYAYMRACC